MDLKFFLVMVALILGVVLGCSGNYPKDLGINNGRLKPCPGSPNCVNSQADISDEKHFIAPLTYTLAYAGTIEKASDTIVSILQTMEKNVITEKNKNYIRVAFTSPVMGFVDDVEFYFPEQSVIHVRSASRKGYSDFGVNRQRIESVRALFEKAETRTHL